MSIILKPTLGSQLNLGHRLSQGLAGYWLLNEGSGNIVFDLSGNGYTGTFNGTAPAWVPDKFGSAVRLPGTNEYINFPLTGLVFGTSMSILFWFTPDDITSSIYLSDFSDDNEFACIAGYQDGFYNVYGGNYPGAGGPGDSRIPMSGAGILDFVAWVKDGTNLKGYVNGVLEAETTIALGDFLPGDTSDGLRIGTQYSGASYAKGKFSQYLLYNNSALSASEIAELYLRPFAMFDRTPLELWVGATSVGVPPGVVMSARYYRHLLQGVA